jgi:hypothetical protein
LTRPTCTIRSWFAIASEVLLNFAIETIGAGRRIAIPHIHPKRAVIAQHSAYRAEHGNHLDDVLLGRGFKAELRVDAAGTAFGTQSFVNMACPLGVSHRRLVTTYAFRQS